MQFDQVLKLHRTMRDLHSDYANLDDASSDVEITRAGALYGEANELNRQVDELNFVAAC